MTIRQRMAKGAAWMMSLRFFMRAIGMLSTIILARLLAPEDFGLVAMATVMMGLVVMLSEMNVEWVLIQRPNIDDNYLNGAFGLKLLMSSMQAGLLVGLAIPIGHFYSEPRLEPIVYTLACAVFVDGFKNIGIVNFQRELRFQQEFVMRAIPKVVAFVVTVTVAWFTRSYWALVVGIVINHVGRTGLSYVLHPFRPRPTFEHWREIFRFSKWLIMNQAISFIGRRGPDMALGKLVGARSVGLYSVAYEIAMLPTTEMIAPINRAVFPGYSRMEVTNGELRQGFMDVAGLIALVALPAGVGIAASAPVLIPLLLGDKWNDAIPLVHLLGIAGAMTALMSNSASVFLALGRPYITAALSVLRVTLLIFGAIYGGLVAGAWGVAVAYLLVTIIMVPIQTVTTLHVLSARLSEFIHVLYRPTLATVTMYVVLDLWLLPKLSSLDIALPLQALSAVGSGAAVYAVVAFALWHVAGLPAGAERHALEVLQKVRAKLRFSAS